MIHNKSMKVYCVFSIVLVLMYLEFIISFEYFFNLDSLDFLVKIKVLHIKLLTVKIFIENGENIKFLCIKYGVFKPSKVKIKQNNDSNNEKNGKFKIINFIKIFFRHKHSEIELVSRGDDGVYRNVVLVMTTYLSKIFLTLNDVFIGVKFEEENRVRGVSHFAFSFEYAVYKILVMIKRVFTNFKTYKVKEIG